MKDFIKNRLKEEFAFNIVESLLDEDYPSNFNMEHFKTLRSFNQRIQYCEQNLQRISSGSSRIVYKIDDIKVLKLAKNNKGLAQNEVEIQWGTDYYFQSILAHTFDSDDKNLFVEMELAKKCTPSLFIKEFGFPVDKLGYWLLNRKEENRGKRPFMHIEPEIQNKLDNSDFANLIFEFMDASDAPHGDFGRLNSYGVVKRDNQDSIVLIDFGLTGEVYSSYYS